MSGLLKTLIAVALATTNVVMLCNSDKPDVAVFAGTGALCCFTVAVAYLDEWARRTWGD